MSLPNHDLGTNRDALTAGGPVAREHDLRRRGILAVFASCAGTCAAVAVWLLYGVVSGAAVMVATFMLLVIFLMMSSERTARVSIPRPEAAPDLKSDKLVP